MALRRRRARSDPELAAPQRIEARELEADLLVGNGASTEIDEKEDTSLNENGENEEGNRGGP